jgi:hypothetical protein
MFRYDVRDPISLVFGRGSEKKSQFNSLHVYDFLIKQEISQMTVTTKKVEMYRIEEKNERVNRFSASCSPFDFNFVRRIMSFRAGSDRRMKILTT